MPKFTAFDATTRRVLNSGTTADVSALHHTAFEGVPADPATYRVTADGNHLEPKPALVASVDPLTISAGETVTVDTHEDVRCYIDGELTSTFGGLALIQFDDPGSYTIRLDPVSQLVLPESFTVTVS